MKCLLMTILITASDFCLRGTHQGIGERTLFKKLFSSYDVLERPIWNDSDSLQVEFGLTLQQIIDVDEKGQMIITNVWLIEYWNDYRLVWDPADFANLTVLNVPIKQIWRPDILLFNSADEKFDTTLPTKAVISNTGLVYWVPPSMFKSTCRLNIRWFPFDEQSCELKFCSWTYDGSKVNLTLFRNAGDLTAFIENSEWTVLDMPVVIHERYDETDELFWPLVTFTINLRRRALYYVFNLVVPTVMLSGTGVLVFALPVESAEKISLGVTIVLSQTVFLLLVAETMPPTSDAVPFIGLYFAGTMLTCTLSVLCTVIVLSFHWRRPETHKMPDWIRRNICGRLAWLLRMEWPGHQLSRKMLFSRSNSKLASMNKMLFTTTLIATKKTTTGKRAGSKWLARDPRDVATDDETQQRPPRTMLGVIVQELRKITDDLKRQQMNKETCSDWVFAAMVIDRLCLYIFIVINVLTVASVTYLAYHNF